MASNKNYDNETVIRVLLIITIFLLVFIIVYSILIHETILKLQNQNTLLVEKFNSIEAAHNVENLESVLDTQVEELIQKEKMIGVKEPARDPTTKDWIIFVILLSACFYAINTLSSY